LPIALLTKNFYRIIFVIHVISCFQVTSDGGRVVAATESAVNTAAAASASATAAACENPRAASTAPTAASTAPTASC